MEKKKVSECLLDRAGHEALKNPGFWELHPPQESQDAGTPRGGPGAPAVSTRAEPERLASHLLSWCQLLLKSHIFPPFLDFTSCKARLYFSFYPNVVPERRGSINDLLFPLYRLRNKDSTNLNDFPDAPQLIKRKPCTENPDSFLDISSPEDRASRFSDSHLASGTPLHYSVLPTRKSSLDSGSLVSHPGSFEMWCQLQYPEGFGTREPCSYGCLHEPYSYNTHSVRLLGRKYPQLLPARIRHWTQSGFPIRSECSSCQQAFGKELD